MRDTICGLDCAECMLKDECGGCARTGGRPFGGACVVAECCKSKNRAACGDCAACGLREELIAEFNALGIEDMEPVSSLNALRGSFVNLEYTLPGGGKAKFWDDDRIYLGNQICKNGGDRCYGLIADEGHLMVSEYGADGADAEIVVYKKRGR